MFSRLRSYFRKFEKQDVEVLGYLILIIVLALLLPVLYFYDYYSSYIGYWKALVLWKTLTESLRKWVESGLDNGM